ncbi:unnamed protein product [Brugia pahangi]|uniref:BTB domain-containing protein n=1 Tax=Brugia pahangi TaxID=6280 RepID=A0A0N4TY73_BRUPA|nr:unnamed protein product [Brugia pahangi]
MSQRQLNLILLSGTEPEFHEHSKILSVQSSVEVYKTWFNSNRTERRKLVPVSVRNPFSFGGLQLPRANSGSCRMRERPHIDRSQSNMYSFTIIYIDGGGPRQLNTKTHSTAFKEKEPNRD